MADGALAAGIWRVDPSETVDIEDKADGWGSIATTDVAAVCDACLASTPGSVGSNDRSDREVANASLTGDGASVPGETPEAGA